VIVVYAIANPLPKERHTILYVGISTGLALRYIRHLNKTPWFLPFLLKGYLPPCNTLEIIRDDDPEKELKRAKERERYWINYYLSLGMPLYNTNLVPKPPKPKKPPLDLDALRKQIRHLYVDEHVARADILRHPSIRHGTQLYAIVKQECDSADQAEEDAQHE
jgi:hypothetical protein